MHVFELDAANGRLLPRSTIRVKAGAAPRQIVFRPDAQFAYVLNQKSSTVTTFAYDAATGALKEVESVSTVPEYFDGPNTAHDLRVITPKSLRIEYGHDSVVLSNRQGQRTLILEGRHGRAPPKEFAAAFRRALAISC